jgi:phosphoenolpyruvate phosphomutase / 2-hydroxyethylphosphonate cytidylyltransferase
MMIKKFTKSYPTVFVPMSADIIHHGHINILKKAKKLGRVIVGLMTDNGILSYKKKYPLLKYSQRKIVVESIKYVDEIIPLPGLKYVEYAKKYRFNFFVHGDDWTSGVQSEQRKKLHSVMKKWDGKVVDIAYTKGVSSSQLKKSKIC